MQNQKFPLQGMEGINDWQIFAAQIAQRQPKAIAQLNQLYQQLFNQTIQQGCGNCYNKAYNRIQKYLYLQNQHIMSNTAPKYMLKPGTCLQTQFGGDILTNATITDKIAEGLLKAHPGLIEHFERYPTQQAEITEQQETAQPTNSEADIATPQ